MLWGKQYPVNNFEKFLSVKFSKKLNNNNNNARLCASQEHSEKKEGCPCT